MIANNRTFILGYTVITLVAIFSALLGGGSNMVHYLSRLLIVPAILFALITLFKKFEHPLIPILITATFFKFLGDIFFMVDFEIILFRMLGLCSFIVANVAYGLMFFLSFQQKPKFKKDTFFLPEIIFITIILAVLLIIFPRLGVFKTPVLIYSIFLVLTMIAAFRRRKYLKPRTYVPVLVGSVLFLTVDILHSMGLYYQDPIRVVVLVAAYSLGHYFVIEGMSLQFSDEIPEDQSSLIEPSYGLR
ncbi:hypothetical protein KIH41_13745 [Litoribacter ruber]|uniref:Lysoplasmalogenase n=1 Tax=Litoribacter ruber TaxID=702568 RepID=A0AAP2CJC6_9BACT|nr:MULTISPECIES: lysoplasmalogenase family protein [Litoribacter]MBS9522837.1 hypothetical protein [Litoribacter alkaliphilus]MBT0812344.1 hypothetical protein [Litoribacter ruber]